MTNDNIQVFCRSRPFKKKGNAKSCIDVDSEESVVSLKDNGNCFPFAGVLDSSSTQESVFEMVGRSTCDACLEGYNGCIFAYGQTGSGKTHTIMGPESRQKNYSHLDQNKGLLPRVLEYIFDCISRQKEEKEQKVLFKCSFLEIYNEQCFDLLDSSSSSTCLGNGLQLRESMHRGVYVDGIIEESIETAAEAVDVMRRGTSNRTVGSTVMNRESSRSHCVFTLTLQVEEPAAKGNSSHIKKMRVFSQYVSRFHLIDLAGSERLKRTQAEDMTEAQNINKSLSALGNVIKALSDISKGLQRHIPYRDSRLTWLLRDSLGAEDIATTLSTLRFAQRAQNVRNNAIVNEDTVGDVRALQTELKRLKQIIVDCQAKIGNNKIASNTDNFSKLENDSNVETITMLQQAVIGSEMARNRAEEMKKHEEKRCRSLQAALKREKMIAKIRQKRDKAQLEGSELEQCLKEELIALRESSNAVPPLAVEWRCKYEEKEEELRNLSEKNDVIEKKRNMHELSGLRNVIVSLEKNQNEMEKQTGIGEKAKLDSDKIIQELTAKVEKLEKLVESTKESHKQVQNDAQDVAHMHMLKMSEIESKLAESEAKVLEMKALKAEDARKIVDQQISSEKIDSAQLEIAKLQRKLATAQKDCVTLCQQRQIEKSKAKKDRMKVVEIEGNAAVAAQQAANKIRENKVIIEKMQECENKCALLETERNAAHQEVSSLRNDLIRQERKWQALEFEKTGLEEDHVEGLMLDYKRERNACQEVVTQLSVLKEESKNVLENLLRSKKQLAASEGCVASLRNQLQDAVQGGSEAQLELVKLSNENVEFRENICQLKLNLCDCTAKLEDEKQKRLVAEETAEKEHAAVVDGIEVFEKISAELRAQSSRTIAAKKECMKIDAKLSDIETEKSILEDQMSQLLQTIQKYELNGEEKDVQVIALKDAVQQAQAEAYLAEENAQITLAQNVVESLDIEHLMHCTEAELKESRRDTEAWRVEANAANAQAIRASQLVGTLKTEVAEMEMRNSALLAELAATKAHAVADKAELKSKLISSSKAEINRLREDYEMEYEILEKESTKRQCDAEQENSKMDVEISTLRSLVADGAKEIATIQAKMNAKEVEALRESVDAARKTADSAVKGMPAVLARAKRAEEDLSVYKNEAMRLRLACASGEETNRKLQDDLVALQRRSKDSMDTSAKKIKDMESDIASARLEVASMVGHNNPLQKIKMMHSLKCDFNKVTAENLMLKAKLKKFESTANGEKESRLPLSEVQLS